MSPSDWLPWALALLVVLVLTFDTRRRDDQPAGRRGPRPRRWWRND